jgi:hypothetical protein
LGECVPQLELEVGIGHCRPRGMAQEDWVGIEEGGGPDKRAAIDNRSRDLERPLLKNKASGNPMERRHRRGHSLRSRRDAELPDFAYAIFSTLVVALGPLSLGFAVIILHTFPS